MSDGSPNPRSRLEALRTEGGARFDAIRLARIEALERRAAAQTGEVRQLLDARLAELLAALANEAACPTEVVNAGERVRPHSALKDLIQQLDRPETKHDADGAPSSDGMHIAVSISTDVDSDGERISGGISDSTGDNGNGRSRPSPRAEHTAFEDIRQAYAEVRTRTQLRQALASAPADAGPLNSVSLVHRALARMHALSPEYLQHFLTYVDAVSALQPLCGGAVKPAENAPRHAGAGKRSRAKPRSPKA